MAEEMHTLEKAKEINGDLNHDIHKQVAVKAVAIHVNPAKDWKTFTKTVEKLTLYIDGVKETKQEKEDDSLPF